MNTIEQLNDTFTKSCNIINELYKKMPGIVLSRPKPSSITTQQKILSAIKQETDKLTNKQNFSELNMKQMTIFSNRMTERDLKFIELEKMQLAITKKMCEEKIIPSFSTIERIITEIEYCETILNDMGALIECETSGFLREISNVEFEKKRTDWISILHKFKEKIIPQLISDEDIKNIDDNIINLENTLIVERNKYENQIAQKTEWELALGVIDNVLSHMDNINENTLNDLDEQYLNLKEGIVAKTCNIYGTNIAMERTELMIENKKLKKISLSGFKDYIQKLNNCIDISIEKHRINCDIDPKLFHTIS